MTLTQHAETYKGVPGTQKHTHACTYTHAHVHTRMRRQPWRYGLSTLTPGPAPPRGRSEAPLWLWPSADGSQAWKPPWAGPGHLGFPCLALRPLLAAQASGEQLPTQPEPGLLWQALGSWTSAWLPGPAGRDWGTRGPSAVVLSLGARETRERGLGYSLGGSRAWGSGHRHPVSPRAVGGRR